LELGIIFLMSMDCAHSVARFPSTTISFRVSLECHTRQEPGPGV
jgi:hypothetical protein